MRGKEANGTRQSGNEADSNPRSSSDNTPYCIYDTLFSVSSGQSAQYSGLAATERLTEQQECTLLQLIVNGYFTLDEVLELNKSCVPGLGANISKPQLNFILGCLCLTKQHNFGVMYAPLYFKAALEGKFYRARFYLAICYLNGIGVDKNAEKAKELFQECQGFEKMRIEQWMKQLGSQRSSQSNSSIIAAKGQTPRSSNIQTMPQSLESRDFTLSISEKQLLSGNSAYVQSIIDVFEEYLIDGGKREVSDYKCWQRPPIDFSLIGKDEADRLTTINALVEMALYGNGFAVSLLREQTTVQSLISKSLGIELENEQCRKIAYQCVESECLAEIEFQIGKYHWDADEKAKSYPWFDFAASNGSADAVIAIIQRELSKKSQNCKPNAQIINYNRLRLKALGKLGYLREAAEWQLSTQTDHSVGMQMLELVAKDSITEVSGATDQASEDSEIYPPKNDTVTSEQAESQAEARKLQKDLSKEAHQQLLLQYANQFYDLTAIKSYLPGDQEGSRPEDFFSKALSLVLQCEEISSEDYAVFETYYKILQAFSEACLPKLSFANEKAIDWPSVAVSVFQAVVQGKMNDQHKADVLNSLVVLLNTQWALVWALMQSCTLAQAKSIGGYQAKANLTSYYTPEVRPSGRAGRVLCLLKAVIQNTEITPISFSDTLQGAPSDAVQRALLNGNMATPPQTDSDYLFEQPRLQQTARIARSNHDDDDVIRFGKTK